MSETPAETLRCAARLMRERAEAASQGPWKSWLEGRDHRGGDSFIQSTDKPDNTDLYVTVGKGYHPKWSADQDYIASMHPGVALRVADLLDKMAWADEIDPEMFGSAVRSRVIAVARTYLGEEAA